MGMTTYLGINQVARQLGIAYYKIRYAHDMGYVPEPMIVAGKRLYSPDDVKRVREHFGMPDKCENRGATSSPTATATST